MREVEFDGSDLRADEFWVPTSPKVDDLIYFHENTIHAFDIEGKSITGNRQEVTYISFLMIVKVAIVMQNRKKRQQSPFGQDPWLTIVVMTMVPHSYANHPPSPKRPLIRTNSGGVTLQRPNGEEREDLS